MSSTRCDDLILYTQITSSLREPLLRVFWIPIGWLIEYRRKIPYSNWFVMFLLITNLFYTTLSLIYLRYDLTVYASFVCIFTIRIRTTWANDPLFINPGRFSRIFQNFDYLIIVSSVAITGVVITAPLPSWRNISPDFHLFAVNSESRYNMKGLILFHLLDLFTLTILSVWDLF